MTLGQPRKRAHLRPFGILVLSAALAAPGCAAPLELDSSTGAALQEQVATIRSAIAGGDHTAALTTLEALAADVERAAAEGKISTERKTRILQAIARVRGDALVAIPSEPATPAPAPTEAPDSTPSPSKQDGKKDEHKNRDKEKDRDSSRGKAEEDKDKDKD